MEKVITLIATTPRLPLLTKQALPSIASQIRPPEAVVLVSDTRPITQEEQKRLQSELKSIPLHILNNSRSPGAAGSWNTGIDFIHKHIPDSYIAIIDDDDIWHPEHLSSCIAASNSGKADIILSGINVNINDKTVQTLIPNDISQRDFLIGNPGWQGSNTFIKSKLAVKVDGFTDGLISGNDRDFAIRILESNSVDIGYTNQATVDWICNQSPDALSAPGSAQKLRGSAQFLKLHGNKMSQQEMDIYFQRANKLFALSKSVILKELKKIGGNDE
ncbi:MULTISPECIES: glycosyltransferase [Vibrio]|uniref:glycosyltransferase n=1 Tax=Vibrio TaxID=662 RepID=UPI0006A59977|nr:glycosyltransferase [Vibrio parahaemolyticus]EGQ8946933.1 glycosyltransferase [Vibrio parahaemolyticus]EGR1597800.1 glycosyltransferase [Vibrio parahaemolyticus]EGR1761746.1 glycosyltransferase [Vibrio parahaemolyticus]EGR3007718.1 glycosyltransferase [Vibrio parahaemolyticus]EGR3145332.1 glycosyltransferase [Vibrio parahaemolyticus]